MSYITYVDNYLWGKQLESVDINQVYNDCMFIKPYLENFVSKNVNEKKYGSVTTSSYYSYNIFNFNFPEFINLFFHIKNAILPCLPKLEKNNYVIQNWINYFENGSFIDWHHHWPIECEVIHGYFCVNVEDEDSYTEFKFEGLNKNLNILNKNGLLIFGKNGYNEHRSLPWHGKRPRITMAFDIVRSDVLLDVRQNRLNFPNWFHNLNFLPFC